MEPRGTNIGERDLFPTGESDERPRRSPRPQDIGDPEDALRPTDEEELEHGPSSVDPTRVPTGIYDPLATPPLGDFILDDFKEEDLHPVTHLPGDRD